MQPRAILAMRCDTHRKQSGAAAGEPRNMDRTRKWLLAALAGCALAQASPANGQNVPAHDPYAARIRHCLQTSHDAPPDALPLADAILATPRLPDGPKLGAAMCRIQALRNMGEGEPARAEIERALPLLDAPGVPEQHRFGSLMNFSGMLQSLGRTGEALALLERALELAGRDGSPQEQLAALQGIAMTRAVGMNDTAGAESYFQRALALVERYRMPPSLVELMLHYNYGYTLLRGERYAEAETAFARALEMSAKLPGQEQMRHRILSHRGEIQRVHGDAAGALQRLQQARDWQRDHSDAQGETVTLARLARLHLDRGEPEQALPFAERALEVAERGGYVAETRTALDALINVHTALEDHTQVIAFTSRALAFERESARADLERLAGLQARADAATAAQSSSPRAKVLRDTAIIVLALLLVVGGMLLLRARRRQQQLAAQGATDLLTGLYNRREGTRLIEALPPPDASADMRHALLLIDIDSFKAINDTHGHAVGDRVLAQIADRLRQACDDRDVLARWGGEEFLVVRPDTSREATFAFADHLRRVIGHQAIEIAATPHLEVTASVGLAPAPFFPGSGAQWQDSIGMADRALYVAKHSGRNAWAGIWGLQAGEHVDLYSVRENPEHALAQGWVAIGGNRPMSWSPVRSAQGPRSGRDDGRKQGRRADTTT